MADIRAVDDLTSEDVQDDGLSGQIVADEGGYFRASFAKVEEVNQTYARLIEATLEDYKEIDQKRQANLDAHEGRPERGETIVIPIAKRDTNQQLAWVVTQIFAKKPLITVRPLEAGHIDLMALDESGNPTELTVTTEDEAKSLQDLLDFYLRDKVHLKKVLRPWATEIFRDGRRPPVLKVVHEPREMPKRGRLNAEPLDATRKLWQITTEPVLQEVKDGCATRIECIPAERFFVPLPYCDVQTAPFVFQEYEVDTPTVKSNLKSGKWDLCGAEIDEETIELICSGASNKEELEKTRKDGRTPIDPIKTHRMFELWFFFPFAQGFDEFGDPVVEWKSFCAPFHWPSKMMMTCYDNPHWTKMRPFFPGYMQQIPHSFSGWSTTENVAPFQRLISQLFHLQVQNMVMRNMSVIGARETSNTYKFLKNPKNKLRPGLVFPYDDETDFTMKPLGSPIESMANEITFLNVEAEKITVVSQFDRGQIPNRTPAQTVAAIENIAKMQPAMQLDSIRETIGDCVKMFTQTLIQYAPTGITIPFRESKKTALIARVVNFPRELITEQFAFEVTATADDMTPEALFNQHMANSKNISEFNNEMMSVGAAVWQPNVPPPLILGGTKAILGKRRITAKLLELSGLDPDDYLVTENEINAIPLELMQIEQVAQQGQEEAMGGNEQVPPPGGGGAIPGAEGGGGPMGEMEGQPGNGQSAGAGPPATPPQNAGGVPEGSGGIPNPQG